MRDADRAPAQLSTSIPKGVIMDQAKQRMRKRGESPACPFCKEKVARPATLELPNTDNISLDCKGGRCSCGSIYLFDVTGREGGRLLMEGLSAICDGDLDRALSLQTDVDYQISSLGYSHRTHTIVPRVNGRSFGQAKLWFFKLLMP